ncbi:YciI family protein [Cognatitamlana onchidii]|uniref:YciI family protein n=1 Tax=Cognatitamlana onchidii TaxID=2562860 RepID=UPI0010A6AD27|nr:YciI family protein [Algibacter onchidii]
MKKILAVLLLLVMTESCKKASQPSLSEEVVLDEVEVEVDSIVEVQDAPIRTVKEKKEALLSKGFKIFDYVDEKTQDTVLMQQYFMVFLKTGPIRGQNEEEDAELQVQHLSHLTKMYELGYADISGPFGDDGNIRGVTIYNVPTLKMVDSLANADPMVKAGRLEVEVHPWWAAKGFPLR